MTNTNTNTNSMENTTDEETAANLASGAEFKLSFRDGDMISSDAAVGELEGRQYYGRNSSITEPSHNKLTHRVSTLTNHHTHSRSHSHAAHTKNESANKLGTFEGVFIPTTLNVLSILMFLRFGFILGQTGILCMFLLLTISYGVDLLTTLSVSAIATNGTVKGGGAYYMISRSLGPEFGGSIGVVFYVGQVLNA